MPIVAQPQIADTPHGTVFAQALQQLAEAFAMRIAFAQACLPDLVGFDSDAFEMIDAQMNRQFEAVAAFLTKEACERF